MVIKQRVTPFLWATTIWRNQRAIQVMLLTTKIDIARLEAVASS
jgi:hypothetical protein